MNLSERVLGRRVVNYLKNEALVGRINSQKIKVAMFLHISFVWLDVTEPTLFCDKEHLSKKSFHKIAIKKKFYPCSKDRHFLRVIFYCSKE